MIKLNVNAEVLDELEEKYIRQCDVCEIYYHMVDVSFWEKQGKNICIFCEDKMGPIEED